MKANQSPAQFTEVKVMAPTSNQFNLTHDKKLSAKFGQLIPILCQEVLPGDNWQITTEHLIRLAPMVAPMMHHCEVITHNFFVPNRIVWPGWEDFITTGDEPGSVTPIAPWIFYGDWPIGSNPDYMGIPITTVPTGFQSKINALPFAALNKIYNEYYRDQNLQTKLYDELIDGDNTTPLEASGVTSKPYKRNWTQDYFTSSLPFAQKGLPVTLPLGTTADVFYQQNDPFSTVRDDQGNLIIQGDLKVLLNDGQMVLDPASGSPIDANIDNSSNLKVDLTTAQAADVNSLRTAIKVQEWLERNARIGTRYTEQLRGHFNVISDDARLQRPEYFGGTKSPIIISEVLQTSETETTPQGNMAGRGISAQRDNYSSYYAKEHGFIFVIMSVMPKPAYMQGLHKQFTRFDKFDYYFPEFAHLGEQEVKQQELFFKNSGADQETFGYQARFAEYKEIQASVHGEFRTTLDFWHMTRKFESAPALNSDFIQCDNSEIERVFAVQGEDNLWCHVLNKILCRRKMPQFGIPQF
jgi:hypothetical protein